MIKIEIKNRWAGSIIFEYEANNNTIKETVVAYIKQELAAGKYHANLSDADLSRADLSRADLRGANLSDANLSDADLSRADLSRADLRGANLSDADLSGANLSDANLSDADLRDANLRDADLSRADLSRADLRGANLSRANLSDANLRDADLSRADLRGANLSDADLSGANLSDANLSDADLRDANLSRANLSVIKSDFFDVLLHGINEIPFLKKSIIDGKIDGSTYNGDCACLSGTLINSAVKSNGPLEEKAKSLIMSCRNASRPIERLFLNIKPGDTPENCQTSKIVLEWLEEFESLISFRK